MNINDENLSFNESDYSEEEIDSLVPTRKAYIIAFLVLFVSSITGGLIGYASSKIFVNDPSQIIELVFALLSSISICWSMSVVVNISLKASVEFKSRKKLFSSSKRPSKLLR
ncbi:MAG: hypothetical protein KBF89_03385 [Acidimicrobiia bacterium]|nr:hypothetical protein [Acidimicrobiia bacterium]